MKNWGGTYRLTLRTLDGSETAVNSHVIAWKDWGFAISVTTDDNITTWLKNYTLVKVEKIYYTDDAVEYVEVEI